MPKAELFGIWKFWYISGQFPAFSRLCLSLNTFQSGHLGNFHMCGRAMDCPLVWLGKQNLSNAQKLCSWVGNGIENMRTGRTGLCVLCNNVLWFFFSFSICRVSFHMSCCAPYFLAILFSADIIDGKCQMHSWAFCFFFFFAKYAESGINCCCCFCSAQSICRQVSGACLIDWLICVMIYYSQAKARDL